jgi:hypothetical protein
VRPPALVSTVSSSSVAALNNASSARRPPRAIFIPASMLRVRAACSAKFKPLPPSLRYCNSLKVGVSKPSPYDAYRSIASFIRHRAPNTGDVAL